MTDEIARVRASVARLEKEIVHLRSLVESGVTSSTQPASSARAPAPRPAPTPSTPPPRPSPPPPRRAPAPAPIPRTRLKPEWGPQTPALEVDFVSRWFARVGALALVVGVGFGLKLAIDRGLIGPQLRFALGLMVGSALLIWGETVHRRGWPLLANAVSAAGSGVLYLTLLVAFHSYGFPSTLTTLVLLLCVAAITGWMALRQDSVVLGLLAVIGAFANPLAIGIAQDAEAHFSVFSYVVAVDALVIGLARFRRWNLLDRLAFTGTWFVFGHMSVVGGHEALFSYATVFFLLFCSLPFIHHRFDRRSCEPLDVSVFVGNAVVFFISGMSLLAPDLRGLFTMSLAVVMGALAFAARRFLPKEDRLWEWACGAGVAFLTLWGPIQLDQPWLGPYWAVEGAAISLIGARLESRLVGQTGWALFGASLVPALLLAEHRVEDVLISSRSLAFAIEIASAYAICYGLRAASKEERTFGSFMGVIGNLLTIYWLSLEALDHFDPETSIVATQAFEFALSAIWGTYAGALLAIGVAFRLMTARFLAVGILGVTLGKMVVRDVWFLTTGHRMLVFIGMGLLLLLCSTMYHRFKDVLIGKSQNV